MEKFSKDFRVLAALVRTLFSLEQTLMSWIRTSLSLFTFGFAIAKFFYFLGPQEDGNHVPSGPQQFGISLIGVGILVLILAMAEHLQRHRKLKKQGLPPGAVSFLPIGSALALLLIGIVALISIVLNWQL